MAEDKLINDAPRIQQWMHQRSRLPIQQEFRGVAREVDGKIVAAFGYDSFQDTLCQLHLCVDSPTAISRKLLRTAFWVPFVQWNYSSLLAIIRTDNAKSLNMAARLGFEEFAVLPGSLHFSVMHRDKCRWIYPAGGST